MLLESAVVDPEPMKKEIWIRGVFGFRLRPSGKTEGMCEPMSAHCQCVACSLLAVCAGFWIPTPFSAYFINHASLPCPSIPMQRLA